MTETHVCPRGHINRREANEARMPARAHSALATKDNYDLPLARLQGRNLRGPAGGRGTRAPGSRWAGITDLWRKGQRRVGHPLPPPGRFLNFFFLVGGISFYLGLRTPNGAFGTRENTHALYVKRTELSNWGVEGKHFKGVWVLVRTKEIDR